MKKLMKMALGAVCLASCVARADVPRVIIDTDLGSNLDDILAIDFATGLAAFASSDISSFAPEVWFRFDDKSVSGYQQNEGTLGNAVSFVGSYSTKGLNKGARC